MSRYIYYNINPEGETLPDCVCRAISLATNIDYYRVEELLEFVGDYYCCEDLCVSCYSNLIENIFGFQVFDANGMKVSELSDMYPNDILLIRINSHLTCSICGLVLDIWNCLDEEADRYWIVER